MSMVRLCLQLSLALLIVFTTVVSIFTIFNLTDDHLKSALQEEDPPPGEKEKKRREHIGQASEPEI